MLNKLKQALTSMRTKEVAPTEGAGHTQPERHACAALLMRVAWLDGHLDGSEEEALTRVMVDRFQISTEEVADILTEAARDAEDSTDLYRYTKVLRDTFDEQERVALLEMLWEVVYADHKVHDFEAQVMRRLAGLLYVDDRDSAGARQRALGKLGLAGADGKF